MLFMAGLNKAGCCCFLGSIGTFGGGVGWLAITNPKSSEHLYIYIYAHIFRVC